MKERRKFWFAFALLTALFAVLFIAQGTKIQARSNTTPLTADDAKTIFDSKCAECHGKDGRSRTFKSKHFVHARDLTNAQWQADVTDERLFNSIRNGKGKMPAFGRKLSDSQIDSLVAYVRRFKR
jgi:mono/diheme cytochrome c family protein